MLISVILPAYNVQDTIGESIDSILSQTFTDFELIIINDGSQDNTEEVILAYSDKRIRYYQNEQNKGLIYTLNRGLDLAQGKYIARMDADDVSLPTRFEKQVKVMEENSNIVVCGTLIEPFGVKGTEKIEMLLLEKSDDIKDCLFLRSCFAHPTVMIRKKVLVDNNVRYNLDYPYAEDYRMWIDLSFLGDFYNIQEPLLRYRLSEGQVSSKYKNNQRYTALICRRSYISRRLRDSCLDRMIELGVDVKTIQYIKQKKYSKQLIELSYFSLAYYDLKSFLYLFVSGDFIRFKFLTLLALVNRFFVAKYKLI